MAKLSDKIITKIQELVKKGLSASDIANRLEVSKKAVYKYSKPTSGTAEAKTRQSLEKLEPPKAKEVTSVGLAEVQATETEPRPLAAEKATRTHAVLFGSHVTREAILNAAASLEPRKVRKHAVEVSGRVFPVCQIVAAAAHIPEDRKKFFTTEDAKRVLTQLQFQVTTPAV